MEFLVSDMENDEDDITIRIGGDGIYINGESIEGVVIRHRMMAKNFIKALHRALEEMGWEV